MKKTNKIYVPLKTCYSILGITEPIASNISYTYEKSDLIGYIDHPFALWALIKLRADIRAKSLVQLAVIKKAKKKVGITLEYTRYFTYQEYRDILSHIDRLIESYLVFIELNHFMKEFEELESPEELILVVEILEDSLFISQLPEFLKDYYHEKCMCGFWGFRSSYNLIYE